MLKLLAVSWQHLSFIPLRSYQKNPAAGCHLKEGETRLINIDI
ncbi:hypothetical protein CJA_2371 [Cellvibrio japonicus Ueda107]|uniref:Uncharacterized protein n=1 Tax=Cellvibrio japonicus (strain Ueda107) TaxID=498211 RepID=B3PK09_CELJU|nr:hypothetical protein CJA_2371 [Cellvibrio japonicus Ueda107]